MDSRTRQENRLAGETSPYLLQHKDNPVDWHPWGADALETARREHKPILLSVGYAACHWCHVMAHESFEDPATAELMNRHFVNIKVDREERPDLDTIYQQALALLGEHGGWPLTMFLTPQGEPFWGGTYFPPESKFGRPGFKQVLQGIAAVYRDEPEKVQQNVAALGEALDKLARPRPGDGVDPQALDEAAGRLIREVDPQEGGIGGPPKFPQVSILKLFWRAWTRSGNEPFRNAVLLTLDRMCQGGIYDHLGGGFARYAVDRAWLVPHFEKMLYDNAQLVQILTWAWQDTGNPLYAERVRETVDWVLREMIAVDADGRPVGAFAASLDADSEGEEGKFYVWGEAEIDRVLGDDAALFKRHYDVRPGGNWEGKTILNRSRAPERADAATEAKLAALRGKLLEARGARVRPGWDDKVLADWNGLMIAALAEAAPVFEQPDWLRAAQDAFAFVAGRMTEEGRLKHAWRRGRLAHPATVDDYAAMCRAALCLHEMTGEPGYLERAEVWCEVLDRHHWDAGDGGYFLTADDTDDVIVRTKAAHDSAVPSGNGMMLGVLARLFYLTGRDHYRQRAEALVRAFAGELQRNFVALTTLLNNIELLNNALQVVIVGERGAPDTEALLARVFAVSLPNRVLQVTGPDDALPEGHPAAGKGRQDGRATAYVCRGPSCSLPITAPQELATALAA